MSIVNYQWSINMRIELLHGTIADSYHLLITSGDSKVVVTIDKAQAVEVSQKLGIPIQDY